MRPLVGGFTKNIGFMKWKFKFNINGEVLNDLGQKRNGNCIGLQ